MAPSALIELILDNCAGRLLDASPPRFALQVRPDLEIEATVAIGNGRSVIELAMPGLEGFELYIARGDRWFDEELGDAGFDAEHTIETNDVALTRWWMDPTARGAVRNARYSILVPDRAKPPVQQVGTPRYRQDPRWWSLRLFGDVLQLVAAAELDGSYIGLAMTEAATIAGRGLRWFDMVRAPGVEIMGFRLGHAIARARDSRGHVLDLALTRRPFGPDLACFSLVATSALDTQGHVVLAHDDLDRRCWSALRASVDADHLRHKLAGSDPPPGYTIAAANAADADLVFPLVAHPAFATSPPCVARIRPGAVDLIWTAERAGLDDRVVRAAIELRSALGGATPTGPYR